MNALFYILKRSLVNIIKGLAKKPAALIAYIFIALFFIAMFIISGLPGNDKGKSLNQDVVTAIYVAYIAFIFIVSLLSSLANGASFFRLADVNFLFTAPIKPGSILIYGFIKQIATNLAVMFFISFQYPNWKRLLGLQDGAGLFLALAYILIIISGSFLSIALYSFVSRDRQRRRFAKTAIYAGLAAFAAPAVIEALKTGKLLDSAVNWFSSDAVKYIPLIGWIRQVMLGTVTGFTPSVLINTLLVLLVSAGIFIYLYKMDTDFYEDAQAGTETREQIVNAFREGKTAAAAMPGTKYRKVRFSFTLEGGKAILQKQLLLQRKTSIGFVKPRTVVLLICAVIAAISIKLDPGIIMMILLGASIYVMMLFNMMGFSFNEFSRHYIYLIPASPFSKMIYSTLPDIMGISVDGLLIMGISGIVANCPVDIIISSILTYIIIGAVFIYSDLFIRRIFGKIHAKMLKVFFRIFLLMIILMLMIIPAAVVASMTNNYALAILAAAGLSGVLALLFMGVGVGLFEHPEFEG